MIFVRLYDFFRVRRPLFWTLVSLLVLLLAFGASRIGIEEDISRIFPNDPRVKDLRDVFQRSRFVERLVLMVAQNDTTGSPIPDSLVVVAGRMEEQLRQKLKPYVKDVSGRVGEDQLLVLFNIIHDHLPVFLDDRDFNTLDSISRDGNIPAVLAANYRQLVSPSGIALKRVIVKDPLGYSFLVLRKLQQLQFDPNYDLYDDYIMTKDRNTLVMFVESEFDPQDTRHNTEFLHELDKVINELSIAHPEVKVTYFGGASVAVGNANQLRHDSFLTITIMVVLIAVLLLGYFRRKRVPFLILVPVVFGGLFALCSIYLVKGSVSVLALAAGSVILGIAVNYALHFLVHMSHVRDVRVVISELAWPLTIGGATTVLAFFCLQFVNASVLQDIGLFAAFSLIGAALCTLVVLPHIVQPELFRDTTHKPRRSFSIAPWIKKVAIAIVLVMTMVFFWFAGDVRFNTDISRLNFMNESTRAAQQQLEHINKGSLGSVYVVSRGADLEHALRKAEMARPVLEELKQKNIVTRFTTPALLLVSDSLQQLRINRWEQYWSEARRTRASAAVRQGATALKFSPAVMDNFDSLVSKKYRRASDATLKPIRDALFENFIITGVQGDVIISLAQAAPANKPQVIEAFNTTTSGAVDRQMLANMFVEYVHADFNFIVTITAVLVFAALFLSFGRIELTLITFVPMFITWIWILGIMAMLNIEFNIVNVMVSTFIFGLGDDYSIFVMDGMLQQYRTGKQNMASIRDSIVISSLATIAGLGVLIFAQHPALRSIATISIIGIVCVLIMSQLIEPYLFRWLITNRVAKARPPMTWFGIFRTFFTYGYFIVGSMLITLIGLLISIIPGARKAARYFVHIAICFSNRTLIYLTPSLTKRIFGRDANTFSKPAVIVANHSSLLDILLVTMLHPKLILLTNKWVWESPVFGGVVRLADYYPVTEGAEDSVSEFAARISEGFSIVVFPEGKRTEDGHIHRFHKGAFYLAERLQLPIRPLLIHGAAEAIPRGTFYANKGILALKFLPLIEQDDLSFGEGYATRTKEISRHFKAAYANLAASERTPEFYRQKLLSNYLYKGPVLEWYTRIKTQMEGNYALFNDLLPASGRIIDLGCGYGYLCYMLQYLSVGRTITGVDYDEDKIETAQHGYSRTERLQFIHGDVTTHPLERAYFDGIVINDVLHYLPHDSQDLLIRRCIDALSDDGVLIIRDGNVDLGERHKGTRMTEFFSVKLLGFNKAVNELHFVSGEHIRQVASDMTIEVIDQAKFTSNVIFVLRKRNTRSNRL
ncbi:1-acyl-sn-glycerol-3-phosphate acyltransferase [Chryseolinea sp. T2]|uniref:1-acyl-sn-glycerol-3-phosphate acyltransferase n=1 Tax=Chryseolinea sp. T2 TaxID=3129255 RepID=UPI003076B083